MGGDWDRKEPKRIDPEYEPRYELYRRDADRFSECIFFRSLEDRFRNDIPWEKTEWYQRSVEFVQSGSLTSKSITSTSGLDRRCEEIDRLFENIRTEGYRSQSELGNYPVATNEVTVDIGRDGELLFVNGRNRLSIAKILGLETIPVGVFVRHENWMQRRERVAGSADIFDVPYTDHPDMQDLIPAE